MVHVAPENYVTVNAFLTFWSFGCGKVTLWDLAARGILWHNAGGKPCQANVTWTGRCYLRIICVMLCGSHESRLCDAYFQYIIVYSTYLSICVLSVTVNMYVYIYIYTIIYMHLYSVYAQANMQMHIVVLYARPACVWQTIKSTGSTRGQKLLKNFW